MWSHIFCLKNEILREHLFWSFLDITSFKNQYLQGLHSLEKKCERLHPKSIQIQGLNLNYYFSFFFMCKYVIIINLKDIY